MAESVKDAAIAAILVAVLGFFFFALRTDIVTGGLELTYRWGLWFIAIAITFGVRLLLNLFVFKATKPVTSGIKINLPSGLTGTIGRFIGPVLLLLAMCLPFIVMALFPSRDRQFIDLAILIMTYVMLGWGLNVVVGLAGLLDLGYVAFYAAAAGRSVGRNLGHYPGLSGAAVARRLPRHRDAGVRGNHPRGVAQLVSVHRRS